MALTALTEMRRYWGEQFGEMQPTLTRRTASMMCRVLLSLTGVSLSLGDATTSFDVTGVTGEVLLTLEAMKMETAIHAERDGVIERVVAGPGTQVDAKDLLIVFTE